MHWHPAMESGEPGDRTFEAGMVNDPVRWLEHHLGRLELLLVRSGVSVDDQMHADAETIREVVADIVAAVERGLQWARVDPWPTVLRDDRGLAVAQ